MLGIGLMLFCLRGLNMSAHWKTGSLKLAFWSMNIGLIAMVLLSLLPVGIAQAIASIDKGMWYARSAELLNQPWMQTLKWMRAIGDTMFAVGIVALGYFVFGLAFGWSVHKHSPTEAKPASRRLEEPAEALN
jgi:nitric oxide reductase subunit B